MTVTQPGSGSAVRPGLDAAREELRRDIVAKHKLVDATIIRSILLPAVMRLLADWNWDGPSATGATVSCPIPP